MFGAFGLFLRIQLPPEKKNAISHRHNALYALLEKLK